jgi:DNA polymerase
MPVLFRDVETRSVLRLEDAGVWRYAADPSTEIICVGYAVDDGPDQIWYPGQAIPPVFFEAARNPDWIVVAHNDSFETAIEERVLAPRHAWPIVPLERHRCTMAMALASALPGKLGAVAEVLDLPLRKDAEGARLMRQMARPRKARPGEDPAKIYFLDDPAHLARLKIYCCRDVEIVRELFRRLPPLTASEQALCTLDAKINRRGFATDGHLLEAASCVAVAASQAAREELRSITDGALKSTDQVTALQAWLAERGCEVKDVRKATLRHVLRRKELDPVVRRVVELRLCAAHAAAAKIDKLLAWRCADGRVRGTLRFHGAGTGRFTGHGPQPQNFKRDGDGVEKKCEAIATGDLAHVARLYPQPLEVVGDIARAMIRAAPGHYLIIGDFSGVESRITAWVSDQQSKLEQWAKFDHTRDPKDEPYYIIGRACGRPEATARAIGKTADLAFGFMGGPGAWDRLAPEDDTSSEDDKRRYQRIWRSMYPHTVQFWGGINRAAINAVDRPNTTITHKRFTLNYDGTFLRIILPSGERSLAYPFPRLATDKFGNAMVMFKDNAAGKWTDCHFGKGAYGGLWTENVVQAIARDLLAAAMRRLETAGYSIVLHVHDEIVAELPNGFGSVDEFQRIITTLPGWAGGLPIAAKVRKGPRFCKVATEPETAQVVGDHAGETRDDERPDDPVKDHNPADDGTEKEARRSNGQGRPDANQRQEGNDHNHDGYPHGERRTGRRLAVYLYRDHLKNPHSKVEKWVARGAKRAQYPQSFWVGGHWVPEKPKGWQKIPYRLPEMLEVLAKHPNADVLIPEGEKDCDTLAALDFVATTNAEGATPLKAKIGKWTPELNKWFHGVRRLFILADHDDVGRAFAREKARALEGLVPDIRIVLFPDVPEGEDVTYWLKALGHTKEELLARCEAAPRWGYSGSVLVRASDIVPRAMDWLWQGHLLRGSQELLTGVPGNGKSQIHCAFVAYVSTGSAWPDGCNGAPAANVIMLTAEDCLDQTIVPRLIAAGADRDRVFILKKIRKDNKERMFLLSEDLEELERTIVKTGDVRLITIDPITAYMGGKLDSHRATDVRDQLGPLADLAERMDVALSAITHPPKHATQRAIDHFIGSQAFIAAARIGHMTIEEVSEDKYGNRVPTGRGLFTNAKNNVNRKMSTWAYRISEKQVASGIKAAYVTWEEIIDITADQAIAAATPTKERGQQSNVIIFLLDILMNGPVPAKLIEERAAARNFSKDQLDRAKKKMRIAAFKETGKFDGQWLWALPQHASAKTKA